MSGKPEDESSKEGVPVSEMLKGAIQESGLPLTVLAADSGISYGTLRLWSMGAVAQPDPENLAKLAETLGRRAHVLHGHATKLGREAKRHAPATEGNGE